MQSLYFPLNNENFIYSWKILNVLSYEVEQMY